MIERFRKKLHLDHKKSVRPKTLNMGAAMQHDYQMPSGPTPADVRRIPSKSIDPSKLNISWDTTQDQFGPFTKSLVIKEGDRTLIHMTDLHVSQHELLQRLDHNLSFIQAHVPLGQAHMDVISQAFAQLPPDIAQHWQTMDKFAPRAPVAKKHARGLRGAIDFFRRGKKEIKIDSSKLRQISLPKRED